MNTREDAKLLLFDFLSVRPCRKISAACVEEFCGECERRGVSLLVVLELLLDVLRTYKGFGMYGRREHDGAGGEQGMFCGVRRVEITDDGAGLEIEGRDGTVFRAQRGQQVSLQWRGNGGSRVVSRNEIEDTFGLWPGYLDALEDWLDYVRSLRDRLKEEQKKKQEEYWLTIDTRLRVERHDELRRWRESNPTPAGEVPDALKGIRHVKRLDVSEPCHVYFLLHRGKVVYVGKTADPWPARILTHLREGEKVFDDVWYVEVDHHSMGTVETHYIKKFRPKYNRLGVSDR